MRIILSILLLSFTIFTFTTTQAATNTTTTKMVNTVTTKPGVVGTVNLAQLKALIRANTNMVIIDTNEDSWFSGVVIPRAIRLNRESSDDEILKTLPNKNKFLITYCGNVECPASENFAERLIGLGYTRVSHYPGGLEEWIKKGNKVVKHN